MLKCPNCQAPISHEDMGTCGFCGYSQQGGAIDIRKVAQSMAMTANDQHTLLEALAARLTQGFPGMVEVKKGGGFFSKGGVQEIVIRVNDMVFIAKDKNGAVETSSEHYSGGIKLKGGKVPLMNWMSDLSIQLGRVADERLQAKKAMGLI